MTIEKGIIKVHFVFLYVLIYSIARMLNWFVELTDTQAMVLSYLAIGFFFWFIAVNLFLYFRNYRQGWDRKDYLSGYVLLSALSIIVLLEYLVY
jgi:hypothetical protein